MPMKHLGLSPLYLAGHYSVPQRTIHTNAPLSIFLLNLLQGCVCVCVTVSLPQTKYMLLKPLLSSLQNMLSPHLGTVYEA